jgi:hypothetical protein
LLLQGREEEALEYLESAIRCNRHAHGASESGRQLPIRTYQPQPLDKLLMPESMLYDAYNLCGERLVHIGRGDEGSPASARPLPANAHCAAR